MSLLVPDEGTVQIAKDLFYASGVAPENWTQKLFQNNHTPAASDTSASYTEASFTGYAAKTLVRDTQAGHWSTPASVTPTGGWSSATNVAETTYAQQTQSPTSAQTIYGYYYVGAVSLKVTGAELFTSAKNLVSGDTLNFVPRFGVSHS